MTTVTDYFFNDTVFPSTDFAINMTLNFTSATDGTFSILSQGDSGDQENIFIEMDYTPSAVTMWLGPYSPAVNFDVSGLSVDTDYPFTFTYNATTRVLTGYQGSNLIGTYTMPIDFITGKIGFQLISNGNQEVKVGSFKVTANTPVVHTQGANPRVALYCSKDGGKTFGNPRYAALGEIGKWKYRARWGPLGASRDMVFKVVITEPVNIQMLSAYLDWTGGLA